MQKLDQLREKIEAIDTVIIKKLAQRQKLAIQIGKFKAANNLAVKDLTREENLLQTYEQLSEQHELSPIFIKRLFKIIFTYSRKIQRL